MCEKRILKGFAWLLFVLYLLGLIYVIVLKGGEAFTIASFGIHMSLKQKIEHINFIPLTTIIPYLEGIPSARIAIENLLGNILAFCPLGFLLPILFQGLNKIKSILFVSAGISFFIELVQAIFYFGSSDIDDIILNVAGSLLGFGVYLFLGYLYKKYFHGRYFSKGNDEVIHRILE